MKTVHTIVTHKHPHVDEVAAILFLQQFGEDLYPGVSTAKYEFWDAGVTTPDGKSWEHYHRNGYLLIGVGGSCFDEHLSGGRKKDECAATLVAKTLGIEKERYMNKVLSYVASNDLKGGSHPFDIAATCRLANEQWFDDKPSDTLDFMINLLCLHLRNQMLFHIDAHKEFEKYAEVVSVAHEGKEIKVMFAESNDLKLGAYARSEFGGKCDVVVIKNQKGNVIIGTNKRPIDLSNVIIGLRDCEAKIKGIKLAFKDLASNGTAEGVEEWYYDSNSRIILNGSKSAVNVPPTKIKFDLIKKIIIGRLEDKEMQKAS